MQQQGNNTDIFLTNGASAGCNFYGGGRGGTGDTVNQLSFALDATAASSKLFVNGPGWQTPDVNSLTFGDTSTAATAATATIANQGGAVYFQQNATAGNATIVNGDKSLSDFIGAAPVRGRWRREGRDA